MTSDPHLLVGAYVVDALDDDERAEFERHLANCESCRNEVDELRPLLEHLANATPSPPPGHVRDDVLDAIADVPQVSGGRPAIATGSTDELGAGASQSGAAVTDLAAARRRSNTSRLLAMAAAFVAIIVGAAIAVNVLGDDAGDPVSEIATADDAIEIELAGEGSMRIVYSPTRGEAALVGDNIAALDPALIYELWAVTGDGAIRAGEFSPDDDGRLEALVDDSRFDLSDIEAWAITVEAEGGVDTATSEPIYLGEVPT